MYCITVLYCFVCHLVVLFYNYEFYNDEFDSIKHINETSYVTETFEYQYTFINRIKSDLITVIFGYKTRKRLNQKRFSCFTVNQPQICFGL